MVKHVQIRIDAADHKQLRILCAKRGCSLQELLENVILDYMANSPELQSCGKEVEYGTHYDGALVYDKKRRSIARLYGSFPEYARPVCAQPSQMIQA